MHFSASLSDKRLPLQGLISTLLGTMHRLGMQLPTHGMLPPIEFHNPREGMTTGETVEKAARHAGDFFRLQEAAGSSEGKPRKVDILFVLIRRQSERPEAYLPTPGRPVLSGHVISACMSAPGWHL